jgi:hypothetical protein
MASAITHNLDIQTYQFRDLLNLFDLTMDMKIEDLKRAKLKVLYMHPDKSKLDSKYFLFYKKAFEIIIGYFEERTKQDAKVPVVQSKEDEMRYDPEPRFIQKNEAVAHTIQQYQTKEGNNFNKNFNDLFEDAMVKPQDPTKNQWFREETPVYKHAEATKDTMSKVIQTVKSQVASNALSRYRGVENIVSGGGMGTQFHDDDDNDDEPQYMSSDLFSKLKFDDLRRVHKDQTVFAVSENDFDPNSRAKNIEYLNRERDGQDLTPLVKSHAQKILEQQQHEYEKRLLQKQYDSRLKTIQYEEKNKQVLANFMRLAN